MILAVLAPLLLPFDQELLFVVSVLAVGVVVVMPFYQVDRLPQKLAIVSLGQIVYHLCLRGVLFLHSEDGLLREVSYRVLLGKFDLDHF